MLLDLHFFGNSAKIYNDFFIGLPSKTKFAVYSSKKALVQNRHLEDSTQIASYKLEEIFSSTNSNEISNFIIQQNSGSSLPQILEITILDEEGNIFQGIDGE